MLNVHVLAKNRDGFTDFRVIAALEQIFQSDSEIIFVGEADVKSKIDVNLVDIFDNTIPVQNPETNETRVELLTWMLDSNSTVFYNEEEVIEMAQLCNGFLFEDLKGIY